MQLYEHQKNKRLDFLDTITIHGFKAMFYSLKIPKMTSIKKAPCQFGPYNFDQ